MTSDKRKQLEPKQRVRRILPRQLTVDNDVARRRREEEDARQQREREDRAEREAPIWT